MSERDLSGVDPELQELRGIVADLAGDMRAWLEYAEDAGAEGMPAEEVAASVGIRATPAPASRASVSSGPPRQQRHYQRQQQQQQRQQQQQPPSLPQPSPRPSVPRQPPTPAPPAQSRSPRKADDSAAVTLEATHRELINCRRCPLCDGRNNIVFGVGNPRADLVIIGEAPGYHEDRMGEPFVGRSGQLLTRMLRAIGLERTDVYISNMVKCRPQNDREPAREELTACSPFLQRQLAAIGPRVIMTVGPHAARDLVGVDAPLSRLRDQRLTYQQTPVIATHHPSYLLREPIKKREAWADLLRVRELLRRL